MPSRDLRVFGARQAPTEPLRLRAGPLTMWFDPDTVFLRRLSLGETEIIRGVYAAVRDRDWGTVPPQIEDLRVKSAADSFRLAFGVVCRQAGIAFHWQGEVIGVADGTVTFRFDGEARSTFWRNRIGFCVLHPLVGCVGQPCEVEHTDGAREGGVFPQFISPWQPFKQMRAIRHQVRPGLGVEVRFEGAVFEMEDQRNWTDASFKTYCTPLEAPFPVRVEQGERVRQEVIVRLLGSDHRSPIHVSDSESSPRLYSSDATGLVFPEKPMFPLPPVGLGLASHGQALTATEVRRLKRLGLSHLRADLALGTADWRLVLHRAAQEASQLGCPLHLALFLTVAAEAELKSLAGELEVLRPPVALWLVFHADEAVPGERWVCRAKAALARFGPDIPVAAGTNANFAELNRARPAPQSGALPCFSINPEVHAFDNLSLMENLEAQPYTVATARLFSLLPVVISPITLKPRFNAAATGTKRSAAPDELPPAVDPRQQSLFAAAWTLGSLAALSATAHVHSLTYFETTGWRGVMETEAGSRSPEKHPSVPGPVFPIFHVLAGLAGFNEAAPIPVTGPQTVAALALFHGRRRRVLLANLTGGGLRLRGRFGGVNIRRRLLDESNAEQALRGPEQFLAQPEETRRCAGVTDLALDAYAFAWLDLA